MKKKLVFLISIFIIFLTGCTAVVCDEQSIRYENDCCLDKNQNGICDRNEGEAEDETSEGEVETESELVEGETGSEALLPEKCIISSGSGLYCDDFSVSGTTITIRIKNILQSTVNITAINVTGIVGETCLENTTAVAITADQTADLTIACSTLAPGDNLKGDIDISFNKLGGLSKVTNGQLVTVVG